MKALKRLLLFLHKIRYYGFSPAFWDLLDSQKHRIGLFQDRIIQKKHDAIIGRLTKKFWYLIAGFAGRAAGIAPPEAPVPALVWVCWWDGVDAMPPVVRACYRSVLLHAKNYAVNLVTKDNFRDFVSIPGYILEKVKSGVISITHFSDILRMALLAGHGGLWLDATVLVTGDIPPLAAPFFTVKMEFGGEDAPKRRWTGFCIGGQKNNILFEFTKEFFYEYWKKNNGLIDYFLIDYVIAAAYNGVPRIRQMIDAVPRNNPNLYLVQDNLGSEMKPDFFDSAGTETIFHKLSWKKQYGIVTLHHKRTVYGYILEKYG